MTETHHEEGWYTDPYGRHEARWMSDGTPSNLVRDNGVVSHDDPPDVPPTHAPEVIEAPPGSATSADIHRADDAEAEFVPSLNELKHQEVAAAMYGARSPWYSFWRRSDKKTN